MPPTNLVSRTEDVALARLRRFTAQENWKYGSTGPNATEPAALACLALCAHGMNTEAVAIADWIAELQSDDGSVGVTVDQQTPAWPTSLAILAWLACDKAAKTRNFGLQIDHALEWTVKTKGKRLKKRRQIGHDTTIDGWSWAAATHSWLEPTCFFVLALKAVGQSDHTRTRSGVDMIVDRLHESGGCNYGNTIVLGQSTLPHVQPTGLAMLAVTGEPILDPRIGRSLDYLELALNERTATASLCFGLLGLTAHGRRPTNSNELLDHAVRRDVEHGTENCYKLALLTLARFDNLAWLPRPESKEILGESQT